jgi:hypothetical protein
LTLRNGENTIPPMFKNPIALGILALLVVGGGVWLYLYSTDPLHSSCRKVIADWYGLGVPAADAVYDSLSDQAKARTTREGTRMYLDTVCRMETAEEDLAISDIRDKLERNLSAEAR